MVLEQEENWLAGWEALPARWVVFWARLGALLAELKVNH
jgi:hypothetical protein